MTLRHHFAFVSVLVSTLILVSCATPGPSREMQGRGDGPLHLLVAYNRHAEMEPCGCTLAPAGGLHREWNALTRVRESATGTVLALTAGTTFLPLPTDFRDQRRSYYQKKAEYVADALKALGTKALGVGAEDLWLGRDELHKLEDRAKTPFLSANLIDRASRKALFRRALSVSLASGKVLITSVSRAPRAPYALPGDAELREPVSALKEVISEEAAGHDLVVVLSTLPRDERSKVVGQFDRPVVWVGADDDDNQTQAVQPNARFVHFTPQDRARALAHVTVTLTAGAKALGNAQLAASVADAKKRATEHLRAVEKRLASKRLTRKVRGELTDEKARITGALRRLTEEVDHVPAGAMVFEAREISLIEEYELPENPMTELVRKFKEKVREIAMREIEE